VQQQSEIQIKHEIKPFRVYAVLDNHTRNLTYLTTTSISYCLPETEILISQSGLEDPNCSILILTLPDQRLLRNRLFFTYDDGSYIGTFQKLKNEDISFPMILKHLDLYRIYNISTF